MYWNSSDRIARPFFVSVIIASVLMVSGCDLFGEDSDSGPEWVGNWEAVDAEPDSVEYPPDDARILFSITTDSIKTFIKSTGQGCDIDVVEVVNIDGNVVATREGGDDDQDETRLGIGKYLDHYSA